MNTTLTVKVLSPKPGRRLGDVHVYLPMADGRVAEVRFVYTSFPEAPTLSFSDRRKNTNNCELYRISEAYVGRLEGETFAPDFRALQSGEVSFAFREDGAGDFVGGCHGDEHFSRATFAADGCRLALDTPSFTTCRTLEVHEDSVINRCHTPEYPLCLHRQVYRIEGDTIRLSQCVEWVNETHLVTSAYMPMLTAQRLDPADPSRRITDTAVFFDRPGGTPVATVDTTPYGPTPTEGLESNLLVGTAAQAVRISGKDTGLLAETGLTLPEGSPLAGRVRIRLWLRYGNELDSKAYFDVGGGTRPTAGTVWQADIYYRLAIEA